MKLLAIETSTMLGGVAIMDGDALITESRLNVKVTHSERLMTGIGYALAQSSLKIEDIDVFAVAIGPGSFTKVLFRFLLLRHSRGICLSADMTSARFWMRARKKFTPAYSGGRMTAL